MQNSNNKLSQFWQELKRRKVLRVITVYAAVAFVILQLVEILAPSLRLPEWTMNFILVILIVGFIIAVILSWIYDIRPEGVVVKTKPADKAKEEVKPVSSKGWKIASYISFIVIVALIVLNIIPRGGRSDIKEILDKSIAVLPFIDDSPDKNNEHIINGIMEDLLINLQSIKELRVPGRTTTEQYRNNPKPIPEISNELNVAYIVEGSGQRYGNKIRLRVQLVEGATDKHIWADSYDEVINGTEDIFRIQSQIAQSIAAELQAVITPEEKQLIEKIPTTNLTAYDFYQRGIQGYYDFWQTRSIDLIYQSIGHFIKAIEFDPEYSFAYTGLGRAYWILGHNAPNRSPYHWEESKRMLKKAISLDPENGWAYSELGVVQNAWDWDSTASRRSFEKAMDLAPNDQNVYTHYIHLEARLGNCGKLVTLIKEFNKRFYPDNDDPLDYFNLKLLACQREFEQMTSLADREWNHNTGMLQSAFIAEAYIITGNYEKALEVLENMTDRFSISEITLSMKGTIQGLMGNRDSAYNVLDELKILSDSRDISTVLFACIYLALGDIEKTKEYLEQALQERDSYIHEIDHMPSFYPHMNESWLRVIIDRSWIPLAESEPKTQDIQ